VPGFSGYFSKDLILEGAYVSGHFWLWLLGAITAGITCFYMFRLIFMTFFGESRVEPGRLHHLHESPAIMTIPLVVLAVFSIIGGWVGLPDGLLWGNAFAKFLSPVVGDFRPAVPASTAMLSAVATGLGGIGILLAYVCYLRLPGVPQLVAARFKSLYDLLLEKYRIDELYDLLVTRPLFFISDQILNRGIDQFVIDGTANRTGLAVENSGEAARRIETGNVQHYAFVYLLGVIGIVAYYLYLVMH